MEKLCRVRKASSGADCGSDNQFLPEKLKLKLKKKKKKTEKNTRPGGMT